MLPIGELVGCRVRVTLQNRTIEAEVFAVDAGTHMVVLQQRLPDARKRNIFTVRDSFIKNIEVRRWAGHGAGCPTICCCWPLAAVLCCAVLCCALAVRFAHSAAPPHSCVSWASTWAENQEPMSASLCPRLHSISWCRGRMRRWHASVLVCHPRRRACSMPSPKRESRSLACTGCQLRRLRMALLPWCVARYPCKWDGQTLVVVDEVRVASPYTTRDCTCTPGHETARDRVSMIVRRCACYSRVFVCVYVAVCNRSAKCASGWGLMRSRRAANTSHF